MKTAEIRRKEVKEMLEGKSLAGLVVSKPKQERASTHSDWISRPIEDAELELLEVFDGMRAQAGDIVITELDLTGFKLVKNTKTQREFFVLTDTGARSLKQLANIKLSDGNEYKLLYRLTLNVERA